MKEKLKTIKIKGKDYVSVAERLRYFSENYPNGKITTEIIDKENGSVTMKAIVIPDVTKPERLFTGYAHEEKSKGLVNSTSYIENCETSAIGRALGIMGIGVDSFVATAEEVKTAITKQDLPKENLKSELTPPEEIEPQKELPIEQPPVDQPEKKQDPKSNHKELNDKLKSYRKEIGENDWKTVLKKCSCKNNKITTLSQANKVIEMCEGLLDVQQEFDGDIVDEN